MARNYKDPTWRYEQMWTSHIGNLHDTSLDAFIVKLQVVKAQSLAKNPLFTDFQVHIENDEYDSKIYISAMRPETPVEKLIRLGRSPEQLKAKKEKAALQKTKEIEALKKLCKRLKVQSPI